MGSVEGEESMGLCGTGKDGGIKEAKCGDFRNCEAWTSVKHRPLSFYQRVASEPLCGQQEETDRIVVMGLQAPVILGT